MAFPSALTSSSGASAVLLDYRPWNGCNRIQDVITLLRSAGVDKVMKLVYDRFDPNSFVTDFRDLLTRIRPPRLVVDISTMSKLAAMLVLDISRSLDVGVEIWYAEAAQYGPTRDEFDRLKVTKQGHRPSLQVYTGVHGVVRVESLASVSMQGQPTAAVAFMSFNDALTQTLLNTVYPARLFLINGRPPKHQWREEATAWIHERLRAEWPEDNPACRCDIPGTVLPQRVTSTLDYRQTVSLLLKLYWELSADYRILLAPSGSKMQAIACSIVKGLHTDIHIEYPSLEGFTPEYSDGVGAKWRINIPSLSQLLARIAEFELRHRLEVHL